MPVSSFVVIRSCSTGSAPQAHAEIDASTAHAARANSQHERATTPQLTGLPNCCRAGSGDSEASQKRGPG
eukprot:6469018-Alexandrium_andersonii.AAC.1